MLSFQLQFIEVFNSVLQYFSALFTYWSIVIDSACFKRKHRIFWEYRTKIKKPSMNSCGFTFLCFTLKLAIYVFTTLLCLLTFILVSDDSIGVNTIESMLVDSLLIKIGEIRVFYYIFCVEVLFSQMKNINDNFKIKKRETTLSNERKTLKCIRTFHNCVYEMANLLNDVFGLSQVTGISFCFYIVFTDLNFVLGRHNDLPPTNALCKS